MIYQAKVLMQSECIEEEIIIEINNINLVCFASICPYEIEVGATYPVELHLYTFNDYEPKELSDDSPALIRRVGNDFEYMFVGILNDDNLNVNELNFKINDLLGEYPYLNGKIISVKADRIDVEFFDFMSNEILC